MFTQYGNRYKTTAAEKAYLSITSAHSYWYTLPWQTQNMMALENDILNAVLRQKFEILFCRL